MMVNSISEIPDQEYESGFLMIDTSYVPDPDEENPDQAKIDANAHIAIAVRKIVENRPGGCVNGAVVEGEINGTDNIYVIVFLRAQITQNEPNPLNAIAEDIMRLLSGGITVSSSISVSDVKPAKKKDPSIPTGFAGLP